MYHRPPDDTGSLRPSTLERSHKYTSMGTSTWLYFLGLLRSVTILDRLDNFALCVVCYVCELRTTSTRDLVCEGSGPARLKLKFWAFLNEFECSMHKISIRKQNGMPGVVFHWLVVAVQGSVFRGVREVFYICYCCRCSTSAWNLLSWCVGLSLW